MHYPLEITKQPVHQLPLHVWWFQEVRNWQILRQPLLQKMPQTHLGPCLALLHCRMLLHETVRQRRLRFLLFLRLKSHLSKFNHSFIYATIKSSFHIYFNSIYIITLKTSSGSHSWWLAPFSWRHLCAIVVWHVSHWLLQLLNRHQVYLLELWQLCLNCLVQPQHVFQMLLTNFEIILQLGIDLSDFVILGQNVIDLIRAFPDFTFHSGQRTLLLICLFSQNFGFFLFWAKIFGSFLDFLLKSFQFKFLWGNQEFLLLTFLFCKSTLGGCHWLDWVELGIVAIKVIIFIFNFSQVFIEGCLFSEQVSNVRLGFVALILDCFDWFGNIRIFPSLSFKLFSGQSYLAFGSFLLHF